MTTGPHNHCKPSAAYNRLLSAFGLEQTTDSSRTHFATLSAILDVPMAQLSDCIRRGTVTASVLEATKNKGINPDYIITGTLPVRLDDSGQE